MRGRDVLIGIGLVTATLGLIVMFEPGILGLSMTSIAVTLLGGLMGVHAVMRLTSVDVSLDQVDPGEPERRRAMPRPGDEADAMISGFERANAGPIRHRRLIREWIVDAAVGVIAHTDQITEEEARTRIREGVYAARRELQVIADFDREDRDELDPTTYVRGRLRSWARWRARDESPLQRRARRAINTIGRRLDIPPLAADEAYLEDAEGIADRLDPPTRDGETRGRTERRTRLADGVFRRSNRETGHWTGVVTLVFAFGGVGVLTRQPSILLAGVVGIGFAAYARHADNAGTTVDVERTLSSERPIDGEETTVRLTVRNTGERLLPDLRIVDGVPERLEVVSGTPRFGVALRPGEERTFEYAVVARRGVHEFADVTVLARDASGMIEDELAIEEATELRCVPPLEVGREPAPLRDLAAGFVGQMAVERGGGVEFYAVREYRPGDPPNRIDWNRHARTGELATLQFREERSTTVFLLIDARTEAYVAPDDDDHAVDRSVDAAGRLFSTLVAGSNPVGVASLGPDRCWIDPGLGTHHEHRVEETLGTHRAFSPLPPAHRNPTLAWLREVRGKLPEECQIVFLTPLCDDFASFVARRLEAYGHPVTVLSPDPTTPESVGGRLEHIQRVLRIIEIRSAGIPVVDWEWEKPLGAVLRRESERRHP